jgi:hypothetical protein
MPGRTVSPRSAALATLVAALLGAVVGGGVSYVGNRYLQESESDAARTGAARVYQAQFGREHRRLSLELKLGRVVAPAPGSALGVGLAEQELIASDLSHGQWLRLSVIQGELLRLRGLDLQAHVIRARVRRTVFVEPPLTRKRQAYKLRKAAGEAVRILAPLSQ